MTEKELQRAVRDHFADPDNEYDLITTWTAGNAVIAITNGPADTWTAELYTPADGVDGYVTLYIGDDKDKAYAAADVANRTALVLGRP